MELLNDHEENNLNEDTAYQNFFEEEIKQSTY